MAPRKDDWRAGEKTRLHLAELNLLQECKKAAEMARKYRERKKPL